MSALTEWRRSSPDTVKSLGRRTAVVAGRATSGLRMTPQFLVVGTQRAGTTSLWRALTAHPGVTPPLFHKGVHYFDVAYPKGMAWYRGHFPLEALARTRVAADSGGPLTGESSGYYMHHPLAPTRIATDLPDVKLIAILRDPVERAYSAHRHELARGFETLPFEEALALEPERLAGEVDRILADPAYVSTSHRHHSYVDRGQYVEQLERIEQQVGRERMLVLGAEQFFDTPAEVFDRLTGFLGLSGWQPDSFDLHNARPRSPMDESTRQKLREHFDPWDDRLAQWLGEEPSWRR